MSDGAFPDRIAQLRARWESDPTSRIFLQLAEEYRHLGRVREALEVLEKGLREHPGYLSALVAKGRCLLELGDPEAARVVLERVVKQDATQMVANKLLVRAYVETGEPEKGRERLDLYTLLNDSDPEIEELRRRLRAMDQPPQQAVRSPATPADDDIFDLGAPAPAARPAVAAPRADEPFGELWTPPAPAAPSAPAPPVPAAAAPAPAAPAAIAVLEEEPEPEDTLFHGLASRESRHRYLTGLGAEGLFQELAPPEPPPAAPPPPEPEEAPVFDLAEPSPWAAEPVDLIPLMPEAPPAVLPDAPAPEPIATATLGELYLRQGHAEEAERIFREVLRREPDNAAAQEGLARLAATPAPAATEAEETEAAASAPLTARDLLVGYRPDAGSRKAFVLSRYLERIRRGSQPDVP